MLKNKNEISIKDSTQNINENKIPTASPPSPSKNKIEKRFWFVIYLLLLIGLGVILYLLSLEFFGLSENIRTVLQRIIKGAMLITAVMAAAKIIKLYFTNSIHDDVSRYNFERILRLVVTLVIGFIFITSLFINWQTAIVSLGIVSLIIGFSLQTVLSSFIGWIYILIRKPFQVGDRIKIGDATGDVIDVSYLDTTLWEFGGQYLSSDHPSGRIIKFPNSKALSSIVYNYSWEMFPYIWNEIKFNVAYNSDLEFVEKTMREAVEEEIGDTMQERIKTYRELLANTPVDELEVQEKPSVIFRVSDNTWLEAIIRYLVMPKDQGQIKTKLTKKMLSRLNKEPARVKFPNDNSR